MATISKRCLDVARDMVTRERIGAEWRVRLHGVSAPGCTLDVYRGADEAVAERVAARLVVIAATVLQLVAAEHVTAPTLPGGAA